jgi:hypothetical protein
MGLKKLVCLGIFLGAAAAAVPSVYAQNCTSSQAAAVRCFVANAVTTKITKPRYGMTLPQFEAYGVAVSEILKTNHTYLVLTGISSAIADAMPPTNVNGSANRAAQDLAVSQIVDAVLTAGFASPPTGVTDKDLRWFTLDLVTAMNDSDGMLQVLTPGVGLRIIDSYLTTGTSNGKVNWSEVDSSLGKAVNDLINDGLMKIPSGRTSAEVKTFVNSVAKAIYAYKVSTKRNAL